MGKASRDKGARGEREVEGVFRSHGLACYRTPNSGGLQVKGDLQGVDGWHIEVKRSEVFRVPDWLKQAHYDARRFGPAAVPLVAFRRNYHGPSDPASHWQAIIPLDALCELIVRAGSVPREPTRPYPTQDVGDGRYADST